MFPCAYNSQNSQQSGEPEPQLNNQTRATTPDPTESPPGSPQYHSSPRAQRENSGQGTEIASNTSTVSIPVGGSTYSPQGVSDGNLIFPGSDAPTIRYSEFVDESGTGRSPDPTAAGVPQDDKSVEILENPPTPPARTPHRARMGHYLRQDLMNF